MRTDDRLASHRALASASLRGGTVTTLADERHRATVARAVDRDATHRGALAELDDPDGLRRAARDIRQQVLAHLPELLERFADKATSRGAHVYWASTAVEARDYVARIAQAHDAREVVESRSTVTEEIELRVALEARGITVVGLAQGGEPELAEPELARDRLRGALLAADIGITGADLAVAETGSVVLVSDQDDEGLVTSLPSAHVVVLEMDRLVATWDQADLLLGLRARSASGRRLASSTTVVSGPRGRDELDGPNELHIVVLDDGRSQLLAEPHHGMPGGIRCGTCHDASTAYPRAGGRDHTATAVRGERSAWRLWAAAWSDARRYDTTTRAASWSRLATGLAGGLPVASAWPGGRALPRPAAERFRDRWRKGLV